MSNKYQAVIFGEVLFDCFPGGEQVLGGAPFNVAWHLQALGDKPFFVSRIGDDFPGKKIITAMDEWGMDTSFVQVDRQHQSGRVDVAIIGDEPHYSIVPDCAYDFINGSDVVLPKCHGILYHGTLALRSEASRKAFDKLAKNRNLSIFIDVNFRPPWYDLKQVSAWLRQARWAKLNQHELELLCPGSGDWQQDMTRVQEQYDLELIVVTFGEKGAVVRSKEGKLHNVSPAKTHKFIDAVGAGDAFTAVFLHGLISEWSIPETLEAAQRFASMVVGIRGATSTDPTLYHAFNNWRE